MKKKSVALVIVGIVIAVLLGVIALLLFKMSMGEAKPAANVTTTEVPKNNTGITVENSSISFANMKIDNKKLNLTDEQIAVLKYFDNDYFCPIFCDYDGLQKFPDVYKGAQVNMGTTYITKVLKSTDEEYEVLCQMTGGSEEVIPLDNTYFVVKGQQISKRLTQGDAVIVYGRYESIDTYDIDGKSYTLPTIKAFYTCDWQARFDQDTIYKVAKSIFGDDIKISKSEDVWDCYKITLDNQSNENFKSFDMSNQEGRITDSRNDEWQRSIRITGDLKNYIITAYNYDTKILYLDFYNRDLKKIWGREFNNVTTFPMDYSSDKIVMVVDNDLYIINTKNGKDIAKPSFVGEKMTVLMTENGTLLIGNKKEDMVMMVDNKGKISWTFDTQLDVSDEGLQGGIQTVNNNYVFIYSAKQEVENTDDPYWDGDYEKNYSCYVVFDKNGNKILDEKTEKNYSY